MWEAMFSVFPVRINIKLLHALAKIAGSIPDVLIGFFNLPNPSNRTMALGLTQSVTEMSIRYISGSKGRAAHKADNLTAICEPTVKENVGASTSQNPVGLHGLLRG
jgi:hypothetical protein